MSNPNKIFVFVALAVCLLCGVMLANTFLGGATARAEAEDSRRQQSDTYGGYYFGNVTPLNEYLAKLGFDLDDENDQEVIGENFLDYYWQAAADGIIKPCDNDILLVGDILNSGAGPKWGAGGSIGKSYTSYNDGTHHMLAKAAYDYASELFPGLYTPGNDSTGTDRANLVWYADYPDMEETEWINNYHFYTNGTNYFQNVLNNGKNAKERFLAHYNTGGRGYCAINN